MTEFLDNALPMFGWFVLHSLWLALVLMFVLSRFFSFHTKLTPHERYAVAWHSLLALLLVSVILAWNYKVIEHFVHEKTANTLVVVDDMFNMKNKWIGKEYKQSSDQFIIFYEIEQLLRITSYAIGAIWMIFVFGNLARHIYSWIYLRSFVRKAQKIPEHMLKEWVNDSIIQFKMHRIQFVARPDIRSPFIFGFLHPHIVLPTQLIEENDHSQLRSVIMHEIAHVERCDAFMNLLLVIVEALFFMNPFAGWLLSLLKDERECCCDEIAAQYVGNRFTYAKALVTLQKNTQITGKQFLIGISRGSFSSRIQRLCDPAQKPSFSLKKGSLILPLFMLVACASTAYTSIHINWMTQNKETRLGQSVQNGLLASYDLNGNAVDSVGGYDGQLNGCKPTTNRHGKINSALTLNGTSDYIKIPECKGIEKHYAFTTTCWIKTDHPDKKWMAWLAKSNLGDKHSQWRIGFGSKDGEWGFTQYTNANHEERDKAWFDLWSSGHEFGNEWIHMAAVIHAREGWVKLYINGKPTSHINHVHPFIVDESPLYIGYQQDDKRYFRGSIDDVKIFATTLSDEQIRWIYNSESEG
ncbi:MAG: M48 family metalloprotease [Opitutales bacterium]|nr:M48 family metalloprotease [Opitutales bacterium]